MNPCANVRPSSRLAPMSTGTRRKLPAVTAVAGATGKLGVSATNLVRNELLASRSLPTGAARRQPTAAAGSEQPAAVAKAVPLCTARAGVWLVHDPLWIIASVKSPREPGETRWPHT